MNEPESIERPTSSRAILESTKDGIRLSLPPTISFWSWQRMWRLGLIIVFYTFLFFCIFSGSRYSRPNPATFWAKIVLFGILFLVVLLIWILQARRSAVMSVAGDRLHLEIAGFLGTTRRTWQRKQIRAIAGWQGLRIASRNKNETFLADRELHELEWIGHVLRQALLVPGVMPAPGGDIPVTYMGTFWNWPIAGLLHVEPGEMTLSHSLASTPHLKFRATDTASLNWWGGDAIMLSNNDVICRTQENGAICLQIAPANVMCGYRSGDTPYLNFGPLALTKFLPQGITHKKKIAWFKSNLQLTLWSDDPEVLPKALARFWGNQSDEPN